MSSSWWASKLGPTQAPKSSTPPTTPTRTAFPVAIPAATQPRVPMQYDQHTDQSISPRCPECNSANYAETGKTYSDSGRAISVTRCFDCGYPVVQTTSGLHGVKSEGPVQPARQVSTKNNFNPGQIVGRIE